ncbi:MAG: 16S rRNA (guanine(527)-N(7))-methyltransferase RsmG [Anaerolineales bacterium]|nr:16S rRNA (guanine(527)-N(7))-methyltransferase RsmG [Anaerolineales bacterium]
MESLKRSAKELLGLQLTRKQLLDFENYALDLTAWNEYSNLTAIVDRRGILVKHFLDSLSCLLAIRNLQNPTHGLQLIDVGSGAGFPGIPLAIVYPEIHLTLMDATEKKCAFMRHMVAKLALPTTYVLNRRAENVGQDPEYRGSFDWAIARAVAHLPILLEYLLPITRSGGYCLVQKADSAREEIQDAERALAVLGGEIENVLSVELPGIPETRHLIVIRKVAATPDTYPRRVGVAAKRPLL